MNGMTLVERAVERQGLPASVHTERVVLGSMLSDPAAVLEALEKLTANAFSLDSHSRIFSAMRVLDEAGKGIDFVTVAETLAQRKELEAVGGRAYVISLTEGLPRHLAITNYVQVILAKSAEREILMLLEEFGARVVAGDVPADTLLAEMVARANEIEVGSTRATYEHIREALPAFMRKLVEERDRPEGLLGVTTGIDTLDEFTTGFRKGELTYVGALPGRGKTSFMLAAIFAATRKGHKAGLISLEMRKDQLLRRLLVMATDLEPWKLRDTKKMNPTDFTYALRETEHLENLPLYACDQDGLKSHEITAMARRMVKQDSVEILFVDFVQIVQDSGRTQKEAIDRASAALRAIAKNLDIPVVVASQLARRDADVNRVPTLQDLRESGSLEQDAHNVYFLYRPLDKSTSKFTFEDQIIIAKAREGPTGALPVTYDTRALIYVPRERSNA